MTLLPIDPEHIIRRCRFSPYVKLNPQGYPNPTFHLTIWDTYQTDNLGKSILGYRLTQRNYDGKHTLLFQDTDFACSPCHAIDSDSCIASLMGFLTLRPGDTDAEYFANYTPEQLEYCQQHAESLACKVMSRFGEQ